MQVASIVANPLGRPKKTQAEARGANAKTQSKSETFHYSSFRAPFFFFFCFCCGGPFKLKNCLATRHSSCPSIFQVASCSSFWASWALGVLDPVFCFSAVASLLFVAALFLFTHFGRPQRQRIQHGLGCRFL